VGIVEGVPTAAVQGSLFTKVIVKSGMKDYLIVFGLLS
jgi:hypothetical protein